MNVVCAITVIEYVARLIFIKEIKSICAAAASGSKRQPRTGEALQYRIY